LAVKRRRTCPQFGAIKAEGKRVLRSHFGQTPLPSVILPNFCVERALFYTNVGHTHRNQLLCVFCVSLNDGLSVSQSHVATRGHFCLCIRTVLEPFTPDLPNKCRQRVKAAMKNGPLVRLTNMVCCLVMVILVKTRRGTTPRVAFASRLCWRGCDGNGRR
jgi:hypothetical protein